MPVVSEKYGTASDKFRTIIIRISNRFLRNDLLLRGWIMDRIDAAISALGTCLLLAGAATLTLTYWL
jgi:hypothetical protein